MKFASFRHCLCPRRSHPAQHGEDRFGPPTLERSGSEHRVGRLHPSFLRREGLVRMWSSLWLKGDGGIRKNRTFIAKMYDYGKRQ